ncbi:oligosaccharide flippase family protein, partial [Bacillus sp. JJ722]|uniref:oligosaccharide flippase family protein n=1 Tax=Bacillus sp. JJ722 TaxID=3122973 RepID=UPI002FFDF59D
MKKFKTQSLVKNFMSFSLANIVSTIAVMVQGMILVRVLTKTDYGTFAQTNMVLNITNTIIGLGLEASINYFIPKSSNKE